MENPNMHKAEKSLLELIDTAVHLTERAREGDDLTTTVKKVEVNRAPWWRRILFGQTTTETVVESKAIQELDDMKRIIESIKNLNPPQYEIYTLAQQIAFDSVNYLQNTNAQKYRDLDDKTIDKKLLEEFINPDKQIITFKGDHAVDTSHLAIYTKQKAGLAYEYDPFAEALVNTSLNSSNELDKILINTLEKLGSINTAPTPSKPEGFLGLKVIHETSTKLKVSNENFLRDVDFNLMELIDTAVNLTERAKKGDDLTTTIKKVETKEAPLWRRMLFGQKTMETVVESKIIPELEDMKRIIDSIKNLNPPQHDIYNLAQQIAYDSVYYIQNTNTKNYGYQGSKVADKKLLEEFITPFKVDNTIDMMHLPIGVKYKIDLAYEHDSFTEALVKTSLDPLYEVDKTLKDALEKIKSINTDIQPGNTKEYIGLKVIQEAITTEKTGNKEAEMENNKYTKKILQDRTANPIFSRGA